MKRFYLSILLGLAVLVSWFTTAVQAATDYQISITAPEHHLADIEMKFTVEAGSHQVSMPAWRSGKYQILELANGVRHFQVQDATGKFLAFEKTEKSSWKFQTETAGMVTVRYQLYANQLDQRTRHIDDTHAYLNASAVLMYHPAQRLQPVKVQLQVPAGWRSASGMQQGDNPHQFIAANYDVLADSPIETGLHQAFTFQADKRDYEVVIWGQGNYDAAQLVKDLQKLVAQAPSIWQGYPYQRYLFIIHATGGAKGATEHLNSTVIQRERFSFASRADYLAFLSTAAHELIHTWNVKAYRPAEMVPYDYLQPNYSKLLWISEGSTSYFQNQLLLRAGLMTHAEFYADLAKRLDRFERLPGAQVQSVAESSFENWISLGGDHADNFSVNIYSEGYLVSWLLDHFILQQSGLKASYATLHQELYRRFSQTTAFTAADVQQIAAELTGQSLQSFWQQQVESPLTLQADEILAAAGLERIKAKKQQAWTGISSKYEHGLELVSKVERDSPAWQAGLTAEDQIVALDGLQLTVPLASRLKTYQADQSIKLTFFRSGRLLEKNLKLAQLPAEPGKIKPVATPNRQQKAYHQAWLGVALAKPAPAQAK